MTCIICGGPTELVNGLLVHKVKPGEFRDFNHGAVITPPSQLPPMSSDTPMPPCKPPLGIKPRELWNLERCGLIIEAMESYNDNNKKIPSEWFNELSDLIHENSQ